MSATVDFDIDRVMRRELDLKLKDVASAVQHAFESAPDLCFHAMDVWKRDRFDARFCVDCFEELSGSCLDEWKRVVRVRKRLDKLGQSFSGGQFLWLTVLGPVVPASCLESGPPAIDTGAMVDCFRDDVEYALRRLPVLHLALTGWLELELVVDPPRDAAKSRYLRSWWRWKGRSTWGNCQMPSQFYILHCHLIGVATSVLGTCSARMFSALVRRSLPLKRSVLCAPLSANKSKERSFQHVSRYAWKQGNLRIAEARPVPNARELVARARFWRAAGNVNRDIEVRRTTRMIGCAPSQNGLRIAHQHLASVLDEAWPI